METIEQFRILSHNFPVGTGDNQEKLIVSGPRFNQELLNVKQEY
jgi:hypothetical protein